MQFSAMFLQVVVVSHTEFLQNPEQHSNPVEQCWPVAVHPEVIAQTEFAQLSEQHSELERQLSLILLHPGVEGQFAWQFPEQQFPEQHCVLEEHIDPSFLQVVVSEQVLLDWHEPEQQSEDEEQVSPVFLHVQTLSMQLPA